MLRSVLGWLRHFTPKLHYTKNACYGGVRSPMSVTLLRLIEPVIIIGIMCFCLFIAEPYLLGLDYPLNIIISFTVGYVPAIVINKLVPAKCPDSACGKYTLFKEHPFPSIASNGYKCSSCKKMFYYKWGELS